MRTTLVVIAFAFLPFLHGRAQDTPTPEATPSAELISPEPATDGLPQLDSVDPAIQPRDDPFSIPSFRATDDEPPLAPGEEALPPLDRLPGDEDIFGPDALGTGALPGAALRPQAPARPPIQPDTTESERRQRIRFREVKITANRDPQVQDLWALSERARTDEDKRAALRAYYRLLHARIRKIDPKLKTYSEAREAAALALLAQDRIEPTVPLNPPPLPEPTPTPAKKRRSS